LIGEGAGDRDLADVAKMSLWAVVVLAGLPLGWAIARIAGAYGGAHAARGGPYHVAMTVLIFAWALVVMPASWILLPTLALGWLLAALTAVDVASFRLPDVLTGPMLALGLLVSVFLPGRPILDHMFGAVAGFALLALLGWGYERLRGREGIGLGDAKLLGAAGAWLGWRPLPSLVLIACAAALLLVAILMLSKGRAALQARLAFGGPLCLATWLIWLYGPLTI
jgi:leader peptidase (prepilin peptidase)/N-methyltransferase